MRVAGLVGVAPLEGVVVSLVTEIDTDIIRAPRFAMDLSRRAGGVVDFSYT